MGKVVDAFKLPLFPCTRTIVEAQPSRSDAYDLVMQFFFWVKLP